jgi:hypothetical protein
VNGFPISAINSLSNHIIDLAAPIRSTSKKPPTTEFKIFFFSGNDSEHRNCFVWRSREGVKKKETMPQKPIIYSG